MQAGPGSNAPPRGGSGLLHTPGPVLGPRPQMPRTDMAGAQGGGSLGPGRGRPSGPGSSSSAAGPHLNAGRGDGGRGMPMGHGRPSGGRGGGAEERGRATMDNSVAGRPSQGPQRSPTMGPGNGNNSRAFGPSGSGSPVRAHGPMAREGNGGGMGMPRLGQQDGRPLGGADGAQGARRGRKVVADETIYLMERSASSFDFSVLYLCRLCSSIPHVFGFSAHSSHSSQWQPWL